MLNNPYGCHTQALTGPAKNTMLSQRNGRILKLVSPITLDRNFLEQFRANNPDALIVYRHHFGDNNLDDVDGRARAIIESVTPVADIVDVCETGYNECNEGINDGIRDLAHAEIGIAYKIRQGVHGMKVGGGCFSVGTPYGDVTKGQFQDIEAYASAFGHLDYWMPHEYWDTHLNLAQGSDGVLRGAKVLRYRYVVDWARDAGVTLPPIIIGEFGIDFGGAGKGFRSQGIAVGDYMDKARLIAPVFMQDIQDGTLAGVVFFCVGQQDPDSWGSFDLAGESAFTSMLSEQFGDIPAQLDSSATSQAKRSDGPPASLWDEWYNTPGNEWVTQSLSSQGSEFYYHVRAVTNDPYVSPAKLVPVYGMPQCVYDAVLEWPNGRGSATDPATLTASQLGVPVSRIKAVQHVESTGRPFGSQGKALIRFEAHLWLDRIPEARLAWAAQAFRIRDGVEEVRLKVHGQWEKLHLLDQDKRWEALIMASVISHRIAFECTSMGMFQILGEHYKRLGYLSAENMLQILSQNEGAQWHGFEKFIESDTALHKALVDGDAQAFARLYNGETVDEGPYYRALLAAGW